MEYNCYYLVEKSIELFGIKNKMKQIIQEFDGINIYSSEQFLNDIDIKRQINIINDTNIQSFNALNILTEKLEEIADLYCRADTKALRLAENVLKTNTVFTNITNLYTSVSTTYNSYVSTGLVIENWLRDVIKHTGYPHDYASSVFDIQPQTERSDKD